MSKSELRFENVYGLDKTRNDDIVGFYDEDGKVYTFDLSNYNLELVFTKKVKPIPDDTIIYHNADPRWIAQKRNGVWWSLNTGKKWTVYEADQDQYARDNYKLLKPVDWDELD